jgi:hypothetical protein
MRTRCKFQVVGVEVVNHALGENIEKPATEPGGYKSYEFKPSGKFAQNVRLAAVYNPESAEDVSFAAATPSGEVKIYVSNPAVVGTFKPGDYYYVDLIPCE